jgi:hypothetical protein
MRRVGVMTGLLILLGGSSVSAREFWLMPKTPVFASLADGRALDVPVSLFAGEGFVATEERPFDLAFSEPLTIIHGAARSLAQVSDGSIPFTHFSVYGEGGYLLATELRPWIEGRERIHESLKAFVEVGNGHDESFDRAAGHSLELLPGNDPVLMKPAGTLQTLVLFRGAPLPSAHVEATSRDGPNVHSESFPTDAQGMAFVRIDRQALWMLRVANTIRCEGCADAEWDTSVATYVFASRGPTPRTVTAPPVSMERPTRAPAFTLVAALALLGMGVLAWMLRRARSTR